MKIKFSRQIFEKYSNTKFHENPSSGNRLVPSGQTDRHTDMTKLIVTFRNFEKTLKNASNFDKCDFRKSEPTSSAVNKTRFEVNRMRRR